MTPGGGSSGWTRLLVLALSLLGLCAIGAAAAIWLALQALGWIS